MKKTHLAVPALLAILIAACGQGRTNDQDTGAASGTGYESGAMPADTSALPADTAAPSTGATSDTAAGGATKPSDSAKANQTKSGVTNTETGKSTLGEDVNKTRPDQGEPVTSKGDTVSQTGDSAANQ